MGYRKGDRILINATVKLADGFNNMLLAEYSDGDEFYVNKADIIGSVNANSGNDDMYENGMEEAWRIAGKIVLSETSGGFKSKELETIFGTDFVDNILKLPAAEAAAKVAAWENDIRVGDMVQSLAKCEGVVSKIESEKCYVIWDDGSAGEVFKKGIRKTGKHIDVKALLEQIRGAE